MPLSTAGKNAAAAGTAAAITHFGIATSDPGTTGANPSSASRVAAGWVANTSNGDIVATNKNFTGGAASGPATYVTYWSAATGGTFLGAEALTGDQTFNAAGEYTVSSVTIDF